MFGIKLKMAVNRKYLMSGFLISLLFVVFVLKNVSDELAVHVADGFVERVTVSECNVEDFDRFDNERGTENGCFLVPNIVHFLRFGQEHVSFVDAVCILAALKNQNPDTIYIHTDVPMFRGKYWGTLLDTPGFADKLVINYMEVPSEIFGQVLSSEWRKFHGGDVTRLRILMRFGGIFLDNDSYIVRSLDDLRRFEMSLGWMEGEGLANQVILANQKARFLEKWLNSYRNYNSSLWYYNAGIKPTKEILEKQPNLVHREKLLLANHHITRKLFMENWPEWKTHYAFHLLINHQYILKNVSSVATYPVVFDELNIVNYPVTFRDMVKDVYPINTSVRSSLPT